MYLDLVIFALFILTYSAVAGAVERTWISGAIIFTAFGLLIGPVGMDLISFEVDREAIKTLAELTLALVLFTDAAGADLGVLKKFQRLPVRLLLIGLPLTILLGLGVGSIYRWERVHCGLLWRAPVRRPGKGTPGRVFDCS